MVYWIERYQNGQRLRERVGPNKESAQQELREALRACTEGRCIKKNPDIKTTFKQKADWYLVQPKTRPKNQASYLRELQGIFKRLLPFFGSKLLKDITLVLVGAYKQKRLSEPSGGTPGKLSA